MSVFFIDHKLYLSYAHYFNKIYSTLLDKCVKNGSTCPTTLHH